MPLLPVMLLLLDQAGSSGAATRRTLERRQVDDQQIEVDVELADVVERVVGRDDERAHAARRRVGARRLRLKMADVQAAGGSLRRAVSSGGEVGRRSAADAALRAQRLDQRRLPGARGSDDGDGRARRPANGGIWPSSCC